MSRPMRATAAAVVAAVGLVATGCGSNSSDLTVKGQKALRPYVQAVRRAAAGTSANDLKKKVNALQKEVQHEEQLHHLSTARGSAIDNAATQLLNDFNNLVVPTESPTTVPPTTTPPTTPTAASSSPSTPTQTATTSAPPTSSTPTHSQSPTSSATSSSSPTDSSSSGLLP